MVAQTLYIKRYKSRLGRKAQQKHRPKYCECGADTKKQGSFSNNSFDSFEIKGR